MATELTLTHPNGLRKTAWLGFSWTSLFFGPLPALFRGDWFAFAAYVFAFFVIGMVTGGVAAPLLWLIWPFFYNRWHARRLVEQGYQLTGAAIPMEAARARLNG
jgi:hypothetical protein